MKLLDCTLRDGGYYTNWDFDRSLVEAYFSAMAASGIDFVEVGLRNFSQEGFLGPFAYSTEEFLSSLPVPKGLNLGVMVDAKTLLNAPMPLRDAVSSLFLPASSSCIKLVRVAAHFSEIKHCAEIVRILKDLGYQVGVNLMQASGKPSNIVVEKVTTLLSDGAAKPDVLYFADSLGDMGFSDVTRLFQAIRTVWDGAIGIHAHNNKGLAVANSMHALSIGVEWLDATVQGMGRGAGNAETEILLTELANMQSYVPKPVYELAMGDFATLRVKHQWGPNLFYYLSARNGIHPTYPQQLLQEGRYSSREKIDAMEHLAKISSSSYSSDVLSDALAGNFVEGYGCWDVGRHFFKQSVLFVASGPKSARHLPDILQFVERKKATVLSINIVDGLPAEMVDGIVTVDANRIRYESPQYQALNKPIFAPKSCLPRDCQVILESFEVKDYGLKVNAGEFDIGSTCVTLPCALSAIYGLAMVLRGGATQIYLAGFDGYSPGDARQKEMVDGLSGLGAFYDLAKCLTSITPTSFPVNQSSLYAP